MSDEDLPEIARDHAAQWPVVPFLDSDYAVRTGENGPPVVIGLPDDGLGRLLVVTHQASELGGQHCAQRQHRAPAGGLAAAAGDIAPAGP